MLCRDFMAIKCAQGREKHSARYTAGAQHVATTRWLRGHQGEMGGSPPRATGGGQRIRYGQSLPRARAGLAESRAPFCPGAPECQGRAERVRPVANSGGCHGKAAPTRFPVPGGLLSLPSSNSSTQRVFHLPLLSSSMCEMGIKKKHLLRWTDERINFITHAKIYYFILFYFFRANLWHMQVPGLGVKSELQLPAYTTAHGNIGYLGH